MSAAADAPIALLRDLYKHYDQRSGSSPIHDAAAQYFDPELVSLIRQDERLRGGNIGALDHDPICQCQDYDDLQVQYRTITATGTKARVVASIWEKQYSGESPPREVTYDLIKVQEEWRIHDMSAQSMPSLRALFIASNYHLTQLPSSAS